MPRLIRALGSIEARDEESGSPSLSTGAIIGIAISGAFVLFVALSLLLICVSRWQQRRRWLAEQAESGTMGTPSQDDSSSFPRRLRKKSILDAEGISEPDFSWHRISLPIIPPVFSRKPSMNLAPFRDDVHSSAGQSQRTQKERGRELSDLRRKSSWIDEDALHGPRISKPKSKHSLLPLRRKLSFRQPMNSTTLMGSPTLPHAEHKTDLGPIESTNTAPQAAAGTRCSSSGTVLYGPRPASPTASTLAQTIVPIPQPPPLAVTQTTKTTHTIAFEAAQQLAGKSRLPETQRPPRNCASATDLSEILQLTAARLQDGRRSPRRQTMFAASTSRTTQQVVRFEEVHMVDSDALSPVRNQRSAPAVLELDAAETSPLKGLPTPGMKYQNSHDRHVSQMSHVSQFSMVSEADSLVVSNRGSQPDMQTALSSPSRHARAKEMAQVEQQAQEPRPNTSGSESSALSTLYSVDEELEASQANNPSMARKADTRTTYQSNDMYEKSPKFPFQNGGSPRISKLRRGTLGQFHGPETYASPRISGIVTQSPGQGSQATGNTRPIFHIFFVPGNTHCPETGPKSRDSSLSMKPKPLARANKGAQSPTPSSKSLRITLPPPYVLRPGPPAQNVYERRHSATSSSRNSGSSANESSSNNGSGVAITTTIGYSTTTLMTMPGPQGSPTSPDERPASRAGFRCDDRLSASDDALEDEERDVVRSMPRSMFHVKQTRLPSGSSVYSQEEKEEKEDQLPPLRNNRDSTQINNLVAELRRMNSQISQASCYSTASTASSNTLAPVTSPTLPALRGGGFSPGKKSGVSGASRNYLAVGSPERQSHDEEAEKKRFSDSTLVARRKSNGRSAVGIYARRARRGTVGAGMGSGTGLAGRLQELDRHMASLSEKGAAVTTPVRSGAIRVRPDLSSDSLYDDHGFLKSSPAVGQD
ncbi:Prenyltransferase and squalene oxidase [Apiospora arundinis]